MTSLRVIVNGYRIPIELPLPRELDGVDLTTMQLVMLVRRGSQVVSFVAAAEVNGQIVVHDPEPAVGSEREPV